LAFIVSLLEYDGASGVRRIRDRGWPRWIAPNGALRLHCAQERFELINLHVERVARVVTEHVCDVFVELSALLAQGQDGYADDRQDAVQPLHVTMQADGQLLIQSELRVNCWVCGISA
jgi:hypothetical protein